MLSGEGKKGRTSPPMGRQTIGTFPTIPRPRREGETRKTKLETGCTRSVDTPDG